jgi:hypothetical protein
MKKIITIIALLASIGSFAQREVAKKVGELIAKNTTFKHYSVFDASAATPGASIREVVDKATLVTLKTNQLSQLMAERKEYIEVEIPYQGELLNVQMYKVDIFANGFHTDTDKSKSVAYNPGIYYRGILKGDVKSLAAFSFFNGELNGIVSSKSLNNLVVGKLDRAGNTSDYIVYSDADMKIMNNFECHTKDEANRAPSTNRTAAGPQSTRCVTMYLEIDRNLYQANGSNVTTTNNWVTSVFNNVQTLYNNDGITVSLKSTFIWTTDDPYEGDSSSDYLFMFNEVRPVFDGDVGQLLGIDPGGLGGVAVTIDGLCSQNNYSYSDVSSSYNEVPTYSWTIMVITHEFGHLLGSPHTHACVWNGNNTPIDNCGPFAIGEEGEGFSCMADPPIIPDEDIKGTIMSYCHLVSGVGINFVNGFGPQPAAAILNDVNTGTCLSTDCVNTCINRVAGITVSNVTENSATISWTDQGDSTSWQIAVNQFGGGTINWIDVSENSYIATGLQPNKFYRFRVRPICDGGLTAPYEQFVFVTATNYCNGVQITDTGGTTNEYTDSENYIRTIIPNLPDKKIVLTFTDFNLETDYDYLYVYDGNSTSATDLSGGGFTGTDIPGPFTSTASDGSLTIRFFSDGGVTEAGYVANVACETTLATTSVEPNIDFTYFPNPTNGLVSILSKTAITEITVYNVEGRLLYQKKAEALETKVDISAFATGTYFFKLKFNDREANFKILKSN